MPLRENSFKETFVLELWCSCTGLTVPHHHLQKCSIPSNRNINFMVYMILYILKGFLFEDFRRWVVFRRKHWIICLLFILHGLKKWLHLFILSEDTILYVSTVLKVLALQLWMWKRLHARPGGFQFSRLPFLRGKKARQLIGNKERSTVQSVNHASEKTKKYFEINEREKLHYLIM